MASIGKTAVILLLISLTVEGLRHPAPGYQNPRVLASKPKTLPPKPPMNQKSIDRALAMYNIKVPIWVEYPKFNPQLEDRGLYESFGHYIGRVSVGPAAFDSWGLLGSTLAHEIEVHAYQNPTLIAGFDILTLYERGTKMAEVQAYTHEIMGQTRFGLSNEEVEDIKTTMRESYPMAPLEESSPISKLILSLLEAPKEEPY